MSLRPISYSASPMFISYAQNLEDVLLWRALKGVKRGTYVDVGANHPVIGSVTYAFYERGWRGINIEPVPADHALLEKQRVGDVNLKVAAGEKAESRTLYQFGVPGLATLSPSIVARHRESGLKVEESEVKVLPLTEICAAHVTGEIHFLKIDVEGSETSVLRGMDFKRWRPWVLVIEATLPNSQEPAHREWEPIVLGAGYTFCHFDGLSRYYVATERERSIGDSLRVQPNVFDDYASVAVVDAQRDIAALRQQLDEHEQRWRALDDAGSLRTRAERLEGEVKYLEGQLAAAREAWKASQAANLESQRQIVELKTQIDILKTDPYFRAGETIRSVTQRLSRRSNS